MSDRRKFEGVDFEINFYEGILKERPNYIDALIPLAEMYTRKKLYHKGLEVDLRLCQLCPEDPVVHYNLACSYALVGKKKEALTSIKMAVALGYEDFNLLRKDPDLVSLHGDPEFETIAAKRLR